MTPIKRHSCDANLILKAINYAKEQEIEQQQENLILMNQWYESERNKKMPGAKLTESS